MLRKMSVQGFAVLEALLIAVIIGLIGIVGYKVYNTKSVTDKINKDNEASFQQTPSGTTARVPASIDSEGDLGQAEKALDSYDSASADNQDFSQLDSELGAF